MKTITSPSGDGSKRVISLTETEKVSLIRHYVAIGLAADQLGCRPKFLFELANRFNEENGAIYRPGDLLQFIVNERKKGYWVKIGRGKRLPKPKVVLSLIELTALKALYLKIGVALDNYLFYPQIAQRLSIGFEILNGRQIERDDLLEYIMYERKCNRWITLDANPTPFEAVVDLSILEDSNEFNGEEAS